MNVIEPTVAEQLVDAVAATTAAPLATTPTLVLAHLRAHVNTDFEVDDVAEMLDVLSREGRIDRLDAAPGPDGLPIPGFRPLPRTSASRFTDENDGLDEVGCQSFPASDPPASNSGRV